MCDCTSTGWCWSGRMYSDVARCSEAEVIGEPCSSLMCCIVATCSFCERKLFAVVGGMVRFDAAWLAVRFCPRRVEIKSCFLCCAAASLGSAGEEL